MSETQKNIFCENWRSAKQYLQTIVDCNPPFYVKITIALFIKFGNSNFKKYCKGK